MSLAEAFVGGAEPVNVTEKMDSKTRRPTSARLDLRGPRLLVEIPESIVEVRDASLEAAKAWTFHVRRIFENYFRRGYVATDVIVDDDRRERRIFYLLESRLRL